MSHEVVHAPHRPVHDRPTLVSFASIALWSWFVYGLGAALAFLTDEQDSPTWLSGLHGTSLAVGGVIGALLAPRLNGRFGRGAVTRVGVLGCAVTITLFCLPVPSAAWTIGWLFVATFFGNLLVAHFSFYTQERRLLQTDILDRYYALAGLPAPRYEKPVDKRRLKDILRPWKTSKPSDRPSYRIWLEGAAAS